MSLIEKEELEDADYALIKLQEKMWEKKRSLKRITREHGMCLKEVICNIDELEEVTKKQIDQSMLKELVLNCPIDLQIPLMHKSLQKEWSIGERVLKESDASDQNFDNIKPRLPRRKAESSQMVNMKERENNWQLEAMRNYFHSFKQPSRGSQRSFNFDDSNMTLSILDENEAQEVFAFLAHEGVVAGNVWGDIHRNRYLQSISNAPSSLTPVVMSEQQ